MGSALRLVFDPQDDLLAATRDCEAEVFSQWFGNTRQRLIEEYAPYEPNSAFLALADDHDEVLACARFLDSSRGPLKTIDDMQRPPWDVDAARSAASVDVNLARTWDIATMGVRPRVAKEHVRLAFALYHGIITSVRVNNATDIVAILDERVRQLLDSVGIIMRPLPGTRPASYLGSPASAPVFARVSRSVYRQRRHFPDAYRLITLGIGLGDIRVPPRAEFRLRRPVDLPTAARQPAGSRPASRQPEGRPELVGAAGSR
ncbi:hypothetical protein BH20ACT6_BH20ACT6_00340 [soil metagenome]